jgi:hypothetical protein
MNYELEMFLKEAVMACSMYPDRNYLNQDRGSLESSNGVLRYTSFIRHATLQYMASVRCSMLPVPTPKSFFVPLIVWMHNKSES